MTATKPLATTLALIWALATTLPLPLSGQDNPNRDQPAKRDDAPTATKDKKPRQPQPDQPTKSENTRTWLGIMTAPLPQSLREHLEIEEGFGIQIHQVVHGSPAAKAGLRHHDILMRFNDQMLISPEHLSIVVLREKPGNKAELSVIRVGKNETISATLGESEDVRPQPFHHADRSLGRPYPHSRSREGGHQQWHNHYEEWRENRRPTPHQSRPDSPANQAAPEKPTTSKPPAISVKPDFPINIMGYHGIVKIDNDHGDVTIVRNDDSHTIEINDTDGNTIYDGTYDPVKGTDGLPKAAREHLKKMKLDDLKLLTPKATNPKLPGRDKKADVEKDGTPLWENSEQGEA